MYTRSASFYDLLYRDLKDYREEAQKIDTLLQRFEPTPAQLLDVGCGTGEHAKQLSLNHGYLVDGVDIQAEFIDIARKKLPQARFEVADMKSFDLGRTYDAVLCLFSSIGYTETEDRLRATLSNFARHLALGGWLVCEPWITPDLWRAGQVDSVSARDPESGDTIVRTRIGETDGSVSVIKIDYEVHSDGALSQFSETHRLGLFTREQMDSALQAAGFSVRWLPVGLQAQPLFVAQRVQ